jgi:ABC-2 type transport system ATP-binding protein
MTLKIFNSAEVIMKAIEMKNVSKTYIFKKKQAGLSGAIKGLFKAQRSKKEALIDFSLSIERGEFLGLIGPNGAGKTTIMKLLSGIIRSTSGEISVLGNVPSTSNNAFKKQFSLIMGQKSQLWWDLPAADSFLLNKEIYQINNSDFEKRLDYFKHLFQISDLLDTPVRRLSLGERMKMELIACLLHDPVLLLLDEPTIGLDAIAQKSIRSFLKQVNQEKGLTVILTSHYMEDIKSLCNRVVVVNEGRKVFDDKYSVLTSKYNEFKTINLIHNENVHIDIQNVQTLKSEPFSTVLSVKKSMIKPCLVEILERYDIDDIFIEEEDIGDIIAKIYKETSGQVVL